MENTNTNQEAIVVYEDVNPLEGTNKGWSGSLYAHYDYSTAVYFQNGTPAEVKDQGQRFDIWVPEVSRDIWQRNGVNYVGQAPLDNGQPDPYIAVFTLL
ncbi:hypothetical protein OG331_47935 [Streptomyces sp. NBC_01017]|uniref:hypothetical protein n=1 Tax=Streptomyces sp. NBC_01017 TaxID=2903721 RepID=UPI00386CCE48|nr:hypothetical protein OG331_04045 [Streptomyces sp. NBC_01017]WSV34787.1 hypothetical protein OG331_47935 [Streptomyces sp. NBC_01017]